MKKQIIKLTENDLHKIIQESVNKILMETSKFDETLEKELHMPYEARISHMTDDEIMQVLTQHKKEQMDYDMQQMRLQQEKDAIVPSGLGNGNIKDDHGKFSASASYVRGDMKNLPR